MSGEKPRILVIDDEETVRNFLGQALPALGFDDVVMAADAEVGVALCASGDVDLVLTDLRMPGMDGFELTRELKLRDANLPIVVMTAYTSGVALYLRCLFQSC